MLGKEIDKVNKHSNKRINIFVYGVLGSMYIYKKLEKIKSIVLMKKVDANSIFKIQSEADILLHCEAFDIINTSKVRLSFSTKIIDYLEKNRCILVIGNSKCSSIKYFLQNKHGFVIDNKKDIKKINDLLNDKKLLIDYGNKAWNIGKYQHNRNDLVIDFYNNLNRVIRR